MRLSEEWFYYQHVRFLDASARRKNKYNTGLYVQSEESIILSVFCVKQQLEDTAGKQNNHCYIHWHAFLIREK